MRLAFLITTLLWLLPTLTWGFALQPLQTRNLSPAVLGFGLPALAPARVLDSGSLRLQATVDIVSNFTEGVRSNEALRFDGETYRLELAGVYGIGDDFEIGVALPMLSHRGGSLDSFIESWHDFFGLPQGGRDRAPRNRLDYSYSRLDGSGFHRDTSSSGIGDLSLQAAWQCWQDSRADRRLALRASLKIPTGDSDRLLGSGSWDLALWLSGEQRWATAAGELLLYGGSGVLYGTDGDLLPDQRRNLAGTVSLGLGLQPWSRFGLQLQFDGHTPLYKQSDFKELDQFAGQLAIGGSVGLGSTTVLEAAVVEDVVVDTAPDVVFHLALRHRF